MHSNKGLNIHLIVAFGHPLTYFVHSFFILLVDCLFLPTIACPTFIGSQKCGREVCVPMHETQFLIISDHDQTNVIWTKSFTRDSSRGQLSIW
jgi:hypothetical protein